MSTSKTSTPHDNFFKLAFHYPENARHFLRRFLPQAAIDVLDFTNISVEPTEFIDEDLQKSASDIAFKLSTTQQQTAYVYVLLEHQNKPDKKMPYRLLKYCIRLIEQHLAQYKTQTLPLVIPLILYNGARPYPYSTSLWDLFDEATRDVAKTTFTEPYTLIDLTQLDSRDLKDDSWVELTLNALKYAPSQATPDDLIALLEFSTLELAAAGELRYIHAVYRYLCEAKDSEYRQQLWRAFKQRLEPKLGEPFMTSIADSFRQEGLQQGLQQGMQQGMQQGVQQGLQQGLHQGKLEDAREMLLHDLEPGFVSEITKLDIREILAIAEKLKQPQH